IAEKEEEAARERAERARAAARRESSVAETLARLEAERPKREAERKRRRKRVMLAWIVVILVVLVGSSIGGMVRLNYLQQPETTINEFCNAIGNNFQSAYNEFSPRL